MRVHRLPAGASFALSNTQFDRAPVWKTNGHTSVYLFLKKNTCFLKSGVRILVWSIVSYLLRMAVSPYDEFVCVCMSLKHPQTIFPR